MKKLILFICLLPLFAQAQITPAQDTTLITGSAPYTPQNRFTNVTIGGVSYRIPQFYNSIAGKYDTYVTTKYLRAFYAPLVGGGYAPTTRLINTGYGLLGGGDLSADRTLLVDTANIVTKIWANRYLTQAMAAGLYLLKSDTTGSQGYVKRWYLTNQLALKANLAGGNTFTGIQNIWDGTTYGLTLGYAGNNGAIWAKNIVTKTSNNAGLILYGDGSTTLQAATGAAINLDINNNTAIAIDALTGVQIGSKLNLYTVSNGGADLLALDGNEVKKIPNGTSGYFLQAGASVPQYFNLFGTSNTWTATQPFTGGIQVGSSTGGGFGNYANFYGSGTGYTELKSANASGTNYNLLLPAASGTLALSAPSGSYVDKADSGNVANNYVTYGKYLYGAQALKNKTFPIAPTANDMVFRYQDTTGNHGITTRYSSNRFYGETWYALGDSFTSMSLYQSYLTNRIGVTITSNGVSGSTIAMGIGPVGSSFVERMPAAISSGKNRVIMVTWDNDLMGGVPIGTISSTSDSTFYGALKHIASLAFAANQKMIWVTGGQRGTSTSLYDSQKSYNDVMLEVANQYGIPVIDAFDGSGLNYTTNATNTSDGTHLNAIGKPIFGNFLASSILSQVTSVPSFSLNQARTIFVPTGGALGTPSSGVATNMTGLPLTSGVTGILPSANGGTGINNGSSTITLGGNLTTTGAFATNLISTATTDLTLPSGTNTAYSTKSGSITSAQLRTSLSDESGTGAAIFANSPTFTGTLNAGVIVGTGINGTGYSVNRANTSSQGLYGLATASVNDWIFGTGITGAGTTSDFAIYSYGNSSVALNIARSNGYISIGNTPATSAGTYKLLTRDMSTGNMEVTTSLPNGTTAPTQTANDNSTKIATTAYVDAAKATYGAATLTAGVATITIPGLTTSSFATTGFVSIGGTVSTTWQYKVVCTTNTLTITAITNANTTNNTDTSTLNYSVKL